MRDIRVAAVQFQHAAGDKAYNLGRVRDFVGEAARHEADRPPVDPARLRPAGWLRLHAGSPRLFSPPTPVLAIRRIRGKGRGVVATRDVAAGTEIVTCPVVVYDWADAGRIEKTRLAEYNFRFGDRMHRACIVLGVISLCNHSDSPNAALRCREEDETMTLVAIRPIAAGEEICIRYRRPLWFTPAA